MWRLQTLPPKREIAGCSSATLGKGQSAAARSRDWCAVSKGDRFAGNCRDALAGDYDADQIQWVGGGEGDDFGLQLRMPTRLFFTCGSACGAQRFERHRQGKLLAQKAIHKAPAAHLAAIFKSPEGNQQLAPFEREFLTQAQFSKDYAVALEQHAAHRSECLRTIRRLA